MNSLVYFTLLLVGCNSQNIIKYTAEIPNEIWPYLNSKFTCDQVGFQYFDTSTQQCAYCPFPNTVNDPTAVDGWGNSYQCHCLTGFYQAANDCSKDTSGGCAGYTCNSCNDLGLAAYSDNTACVPCDSRTTYGLNGADCTCPQYQVLVEADAAGNKLSAKKCVQCSTGKAVITADTQIAGKNYYANPYLCQSCPDRLMSMQVSGSSYSCSCPPSYTLVGNVQIGEQSCVLASEANPYLQIESNAAGVVYSGLQIAVTSSTFLHYFTKSAAKCAAYGGPQNNKDCQALANLCVLQLYNYLKTACQTYNAILALRGNTFVKNVENWVNALPWIFYAGASLPCFDATFRRRLTYSPKFNRVSYVVSIYTMNGTWLGYKPLSTLFAYCGTASPKTALGGGTNAATDWQVFGTSQFLNFSCELLSLMQTEQLFYELFVYDDPVRAYYPVPVRIVGTQGQQLAATTATGGAVGGVGQVITGLFNRFSPKYHCDPTDILVRRFFLYDIVSGLNAQQVLPSAIRYASSISLDVSLRLTFGPHIIAPVLTINYTEAVPSTWLNSLKASATSYTVQGRYTMSFVSFYANMQSFFIAMVVLAGVCFLLRYSNWQRKNARSVLTQVSTTAFGGLNIGVFAELTLIAMHTWVLVFFIFIVIIAWFFFVFFKIQTIPILMLPPMDNIYSKQSHYYVFVVMLHVLACFQLVVVCMIGYRQACAEIFLLDWEPAKAKPDGTGGRVSIWRSILVANEWVKLQTRRKTDIRLTLICLGYLMLGANYQYDATQQPVLADKSPYVINVLLRFASTTFWWILISTVQYLWKYLLYERYITEPPEQLFVDVCTLGKVSVFVLDEKYHGYYVHCRSPHQYADGSMPELVEMLHKEEAGLTVDRALEGAPSDVQSFEIFMSAEFRTQFDKIYSKITGPQSVADVLHHGRRPGHARPEGGASGAGGVSRSPLGARNSLPPDRVLKAWKEVVVFLQEFVENNFARTGLRRVVRDKNYVETMLLIPPDLAAPDQPCVFFTDRHFEFTKLLFLGREMDLLLLNILVYSLVDVWYNSTTTSMLLCYLLDALLCFVRHSVGRAVVSKKTLIDDRFLL